MKAKAFLVAFTTGLLTVAMISPAYSQVTSDGTTNTIINQSGNNFTILNGIEKGNNLFHSFSNFSVPHPGSATFDLTHTPNITTIFSRVTGGNVSDIQGVITKANNYNNQPVNLFLINPAGIILRENARLDIGGSFVGTTASSIKFADGSEFSAVNPATPPLLTMHVPIGLQMGSSPSPIQVQGKGNDGIVPTNNLGIVASAGKTFALVGGDITLTGGVITAPVGRIELGAVGSGMVNLIATPTGWQLDYTQVTDFRDINFTQRSSLWNPYTVANPFGGIQVVGRDINLNQSQIVAATTGTGNGSDITVKAQRNLSFGGVNANAMAPSAWIVNQVAQGATGNGGGVKIQAGQLILRDGAAIETLTLGAGAAGKVQVLADTITATGAVALQSPLAPFGSSSSRIASANYASGNGGDLNLIARKLTLEDGGLIGTIVFPGATGRGGNISVDIADEIAVTGVNQISFIASGINAYTFGLGNSGVIRVATGTLNLINGGTILTFTSRLKGIPQTGIGNAEDMTVIAKQAINMVGTFPILPTLISFLGSATSGSGNGGNVLLSTPSLSLQAGASLASMTLPVVGNFGDPTQSNNLGNSGNITVNVADRLTISGINQFTLLPTNLGTATLGNGKAGDLKLQTNQLHILDGAIIANSSTASGNAGALTIQANDILVDGKNRSASAINASAYIVNATSRQFYNLPDAPTGNTGVLNINTQQLTVRNGANISVTHQGTGNAGQLNIQANRIFFDNGNINATTASGKGGNTTLVVGNALVIRQGSEITTSAGGSGDGGNITINSPIILGLENSDIIANAVTGNGGNIDITTLGLFGLKYRSQLTPQNDITASSKFGVNGTVDINNFGVDPNSGFIELPRELSDSSQKIAAGCSHTNNSSFVATGRGGIPQNPTQSVKSERLWSDIRDISTYRHTTAVTAQIPPSAEVIVQATGWRRNAQGKIELFADKSPSQLQPSLTCAAVSQT